MGWRPCDVYACTVREFEAAWGGWRDMHCAAPTTEFATRDDLDDLIAFDREKYGGGK